MRTRFEQFVKMIYNRAGYYHRKSKLPYDELCAQGFLIYAKAVKDFNPLKASFSTFLYRRLCGEFCEYIRKMNAQAVVDLGEETQKYLESIPGKTDYPRDVFIQYSKDYLRPMTFKVLLWVLNNNVSGQIKPSYTSMQRFFKFKPKLASEIWQELTFFWNTKGADFYKVATCDLII